MVKYAEKVTYIYQLLEFLRNTENEEFGNQKLRWLKILVFTLRNSFWYYYLYYKIAFLTYIKYFSNLILYTH